MSKQLKVAVLGATGAVGETMLRVLAERQFPASDVIALASPASAGKKVHFGSTELVVRQVSADAFLGVDLALFSAGSARASSSS